MSVNVQVTSNSNSTDKNNLNSQVRDHCIYRHDAIMLRK